MPLAGRHDKRVPVQKLVAVLDFPSLLDQSRISTHRIPREKIANLVAGLVACLSRQTVDSVVAQYPGSVRLV